MDSTALVEEQIQAGQQLLERLNAAGIPVTAAAWVKPTERYQWYLYLVTSLVGEDGAVKPAYRRINPVVRTLQSDGIPIDYFEIMAIGPTDATGQALATISQQNPARRAIRYGGAFLGALSIDGAYVYTSVPAAAAS